MKFLHKIMAVTAIMVGSSLAAAAPAGQWVTVNLNQIELTPTQCWSTPAGIWFANSAPYQTQFNCLYSSYIVIYDTKLADRALALALYAKSSGNKLNVYVTGCDANGYLIGLSAMLFN